MNRISYFLSILLMVVLLSVGIWAAFSVFVVILPVVLFIGVAYGVYFYLRLKMLKEPLISIEEEDDLVNDKPVIDAEFEVVNEKKAK